MFAIQTRKAHKNLMKTDETSLKLIPHEQAGKLSLSVELLKCRNVGN